jgi:hypothetical protein
MAGTYTPIASITIGTAVSSITFSSIPQTYTDLIIIGQGVGSCPEPFVRFNSDTSALYSWTRIYGDGTSVASDRSANDTSYYITTGSFTDGMFVFQLNNYSNSTTFKTGLSRSSRAGSHVSAIVGLYRSTTAITSISLNGASGVNFTVGSTFNLYGIQAGNA